MSSPSTNTSQHPPPERPSAGANTYAPVQPSSTLPVQKQPPIPRGPSPYNPPPSAAPLSNRYAPAPPPPSAIQQEPTMMPGPNRQGPPPSNPYAPQQSNNAPQQQAPQQPPPSAGSRAGPPRVQRKRLSRVLAPGLLNLNASRFHHQNTVSSCAQIITQRNNAKSF